MKYYLLGGIFAVCFIVSILLAAVPTTEFCIKTESGKSGCDVVAASKYSKFVGIQNYYFGMIGFLILFIFAILEIRRPSIFKEEMIKVGVYVAAFVAIYFLYLQYFIIQAFCTYCLIVDILSIIAVGIAFLMKG